MCIPPNDRFFFPRIIEMIQEKFTKAVIELKDAKTLLDKKQTGREKGYTPIEQAYLYAMKFDRCNWIIVSNFREIRLYHKNRTQDFFEKFDVLELQKPEEFKRFYYLLCKQNLISRSKTSIIDDLANDSTKEDENITLKFYTDYKNARLHLFDHLAEHNTQVKETIWKELVNLNKYDFESELNVNILGHIFEQSISDIESFKAELLGRQAEIDISRRKKEGIYYTPEFVTKYLVESVVGQFLTEHPDELETIKILDPACGSGAFLNQAHSYLMNEYKLRIEQKLL